MTIYTVNGQEIHAQEGGPPNRQKAILIHGWSSSSYAMHPLMELLSSRFSCVSIDLPGYGKSPRLKERATIPLYVELLADLIEQIGEGQVVLVGHSMGGMISLSLALEYPMLVDRMVLISPTITGRLSIYINVMISPITLLERFRIGQRLVSYIEGLIFGLTDRIMRPASFADRTGITEDDYRQLRADARRPGQGKVRAECFFAMRDNDLSGKIGKVEAPSLVIWGAEDNTVPLRDAGVVEDEWPESDLRLLPKAGHWPHFETPETTNRLIAAYLGLPLMSDKLQSPVGEDTVVNIRDIAQFLAHSGLGSNLNLAQRTRLAAQLSQRNFPPYKNIIEEDRHEMFIIQGGTVEVWTDPESDGPEDLPKQPRRVATVKPGEMTGELGMLDKGLRTADLISGSEGAIVLSLDRDRMLALMEDDAVLGGLLLWNIANAMTQRVRFILWQLQRADQRARREQKLWEQERDRQANLLEEREKQTEFINKT
ncbi:MAG: alpha/beta fold hydrolase [Chloroflexi bacterium]|nr:alpha/beta fold hydrolase [Chloroflexota bacterium]